jgi:thiol-disulfide isomerase/thioredoxin
MGRLSALGSTRFAPLAVVALLALLAMGCDEKATPTSAPQARSQAVQATGPVVPPAPVQSAPPAPPQPRMVLCAHQLGKPPTNVPKAPISQAGQKGTLPEKLPVGAGHWTWINLWAAWCVPCREEMPRLLAWGQMSASERTPLKVAFVSIDDDARQLETFLTAQPAAGVQKTYWLRDGQERLTWLKEAGMEGEPELPAHLLVDPSGKIRCKQQGAIEDADFVEVLKILRGERGGAVAGTQEGEGKHGFGGKAAH